MEIREDEWELIKAKNNYRCLCCGKSERQVGVLLKVYPQNITASGMGVIPLCTSCQSRYKAGKLEQFELQRLGILPEEYDTFIYDDSKSGRQSRLPPRSDGIP